MDSTQRLIDEAPKGWSRLSTMMLHSTGHLLYQDQIVNKSDRSRSTKPRTSEVQFDTAGPAFRLAVSRRSKAEFILVGGRNPDYSFSLAATASKPDVFKIKRVQSESDVPETQLDARSDLQFTAFAAPLICGPFSIIGFNLADIIFDERFQWISVRELRNSLVEATFNFEYPGDEDRIWMRNAKVILDPSNGWAIRSALFINHEKQVAHSFELLYRESAESDYGLRAPSELIVRNTDKPMNPVDADAYEEQVFKLKDIEFVDVDQAKFRLSAFGLSEPKSVYRNTRGRWVILLIGIGGILTFCGFIFWSRPS